MRRFQSNDDVDGFLLNFAQTEPYVNNNFIGLIKDQNPLRGNQLEYQFYAGDAKTREQGQQVQVLKPKETNVVEFPPGMISPYSMTMVFPELPNQLPRAVQTAGTQEQPDLGVILNKVHYQNQALVEGLYTVAEQRPDVLDAIKEVTVNSRLDEQKTEQMVKTVDEVMGAVNRNRSNSSDS